MHVLHRFSLQSARSRCHVKRHLAVLALKKAFRTQNYIYPFQNLSLGFILKIFLKFRKFYPRYSYKIYSHKKKRVYLYLNCFAVQKLTGTKKQLCFVFPLNELSMRQGGWGKEGNSIVFHLSFSTHSACQYDVT